MGESLPSGLPVSGGKADMAQLGKHVAVGPGTVIDLAVVSPVPSVGQHSWRGGSVVLSNQ